MSRIINIECCRECNKRRGWTCVHPVTKAKRTIDIKSISHDTIPDWCPLEENHTPELLEALNSIERGLMPNMADTATPATAYCVSRAAIAIARAAIAKARKPIE